MSMMLKLPILVFALSISSICAYGQDLGSSNKLFGGSKKKADPQKNVKKTPVKPKASTAAAKKPVKKPSASTESGKRSTPSADNKSSSAKAAPPVRQAAAEKKPAASDYDPRRFSGKAADPKKDGGSKKVEIAPSQPKLPPGLTAAQADDLFEDLIDQGNHSRDDRNYVAAESAYTRAKAIKPRDSRAVYGLGNLFSDQLRWQEAEKAYRTALEIEPNDAIAHIALSYVLTQPVTAPNLSDRYAGSEKCACVRPARSGSRTSRLYFV
jgi:tetratricopeptide (TPR) repeat protein